MNNSHWHERRIIDSGQYYRNLSTTARSYTLNANSMPTNQSEYTFSLGTVNFNTAGRVSIASGIGVGATYDENGNLMEQSETGPTFRLLDFLK